MNSTTNPTLSKFKLPAIKFMTALRGVNPAEMPNQIIAGITLAALMIPLNIGYAQVAGLPPIVGLYASIVPMILWELLERYELLDKIGKEKLYATNRDAVEAFRQANPPPASVDSENETELDG